MKAFYLLLLSLLHHQILLPFQNSVEEVCASMASSNPNINYEFCVTSLESVPESSLANLQGLAVIATNLSTANATSTSLKIEELLKEEALSSFVKRCLEDCLILYSYAVDLLRNAIDEIEAMNIVDATSSLSGVVTMPGTCEDGFLEGGETSPLTMENETLSKLAIISLNLTTSLKLQVIGLA